MTAPTRRSAYTLFELVLVLGVLVIVAGLVYPSIKGMHGHYKIQGGVDSVRAAWAHARARAIEEGRPYRFAIEPNGSHFRVAPDQPDCWSGSSAGDGLVLEQALPSGVRFAAEDASPTLPAETNMTEDQTPPSGEWTPVVVFLPDGTARDNVRLTFQVKGARPQALQLRGLTGSVTTQTVTQ